MPAATGAHAPSSPPVFSDLHARQGPAQAESQQIPSTQWPEMHAASDAQGEGASRSGWHVPSATRQWLEGVHCASEAHAVAHVAPSPHTYGAQTVAWGAQLPAPSHVGAVTTPFVQLGARHSTPAACLRHARAPSQTPSVPHVNGGSVGHSASGSVPATTGAHTPSAAPVTTPAHASQGPAHALSQQTPSTHATAHSLPYAHATPGFASAKISGTSRKMSLPSPPATRTAPLARRHAVWNVRVARSGGVGENAPAAGS